MLVRGPGAAVAVEGLGGGPLGVLVRRGWEEATLGSEAEGRPEGRPEGRC